MRTMMIKIDKHFFPRLALTQLVIPLLVLPFLLFPLIGSPQVMVVEDRAVNGQLKRMVHEQWDDWQPDPGTNWLGLPKDLEGFLYWRVIHNRYYNGEDLRPYRPDGPFAQNHASLIAQETVDRDIMDSTEEVLKTHLANHLAMSGSELDIAYRLYFGPRFRSILSQMDGDRSLFVSRYPQAWASMQGGRTEQDLTEQRELIEDRIAQVHEAYMDRGRRIEAYLSVLAELEKLQMRHSAWLGQHAALARLPHPEVMAEKRKELMSSKPPDDRAIVSQILSRF
jgi:hypothetical protein